MDDLEWEYEYDEEETEVKCPDQLKSGALSNVSLF